MVEQTKELDSLVQAGHSTDFPTKAEQIYRIGGTMSGAAIFGGALASFAGVAVVAGAFAGGVLGLALSAYAASHVHSRKA